LENSAFVFIGFNIVIVDSLDFSVMLSRQYYSIDERCLR